MEFGADGRLADQPSTWCGNPILTGRPAPGGRGPAAGGVHRGRRRPGLGSGLRGGWDPVFSPDGASLLLRTIEGGTSSGGSCRLPTSPDRGGAWMSSTAGPPARWCGRRSSSSSAAACSAWPSSCGWSTARNGSIYSYIERLPYGLRSILHWLTPFGTATWRLHPWLTVVTFAVSAGADPRFPAGAHRPVGRGVEPELAGAAGQSGGRRCRWWSSAEALFFGIRRRVVPEVAYVTSASDYGVLVLTVAPFATGPIAYIFQSFDVRLFTLLHVLMWGRPCSSPFPSRGSATCSMHR